MSRFCGIGKFCEEEEGLRMGGIISLFNASSHHISIANFSEKKAS